MQSSVRPPATGSPVDAGGTEPQHAGRSSISRLLLPVGGLLLVLLVAVAAALQGTPRYQLPSYLDAKPPERTQEAQTTTQTPPPQQEMPDFKVSDGVRNAAEIVGLAIAALAVMGLLYLIFRWLQGRWNDRELRRRAGAEVVGPLATAPAPEAVPDAPTVQRGLAGALQRIDRGAPSDAIVAAWLGLEDTANQAGLERGVAETAGEFVVRIVARHDGVRQDAQRLLRLYESVRFGSLQADEIDRAAARELITRIEREWQ